MAENNGTKSLDINALENWLWEAACSIRGAVDAPKFKDYILPLIFVKRMSDVFDDEITRLADDFGDKLLAQFIAFGELSNRAHVDRRNACGFNAHSLSSGA